jgi:uncharacterized SAM-dependent methyltransferase
MRVSPKYLSTDYRQTTRILSIGRAIPVCRSFIDFAERLSIHYGIGMIMSRPSSLLRVDVLLTESALAEQFLSALAQRFLPEQFFYWSPLSVRAWLALCREGRYRNYVRSDALVRMYAKRIVDALPEGPVEVMSLASGQGSKDRYILTELAGRPVTYVPVDSAQALLEMACAEADQTAVAHRGIKADITASEHLWAIAQRPADHARLVMMLGNSLGAFDPPAMLRRMRALLRPGDLLLVDGELGQDAETRAGYENAANRAFALAPLRSIGIDEQDGTLIFEFREGSRPGIHQLAKYFQAGVELAIRIGGETLKIAAGEQIRMSHSGKYERRAFRDLIPEAGCQLIGEFVSEDDRFVMVLARCT